MADYLATKPINRVLGNNDLHIFQQQSDVVVGCPPFEKPFNLRFERQQQRELARKLMAVERVKLRPEKYEGLGKSEGIIEGIEIRKVSHEKPADSNTETD